MNNIIASLLLPILLCKSVIATQKKYCDYKPKKNDTSSARRCAARLKHTPDSFCQMLSCLDLCKARSQLPGAMLTNSQTPETVLKNSLVLLLDEINVGRFTFSQDSPEGLLLIMMIYFPKDVIKWSKKNVLHDAIGSASEDDVCSVVQNINDELGKFVCNPGISVCWKPLPYGPEESTTEDSTVD